MAQTVVIEANLFQGHDFGDSQGHLELLEGGIVLVNLEIPPSTSSRWPWLSPMPSREVGLNYQRELPP